MKKAKGFIRSIQAFMDSARGKTVLNYLYSWGAAIVILGTLFKLTHMAGANIMLFIGMGTEVIVFFFSAFERPYEVAEEEKREELAEEAGMAHTAGGQPIIINGSILAGGTCVAPVEDSNVAPVTTDGTIIQPTGNIPYQQPIPVANVENINNMDKVTEEYIEQVRALNEAIEHISKQTEALGQNLEEMETLRRNLTGVNAVYEIQLRNASGQLNSLDQVNEQTKKMAQQVEELNALYARMIEAMTTNTNRQQI
ncbi:MAG: gliding motility protein GldL [Bacteroidaceae bacterium]|nr:gliding motility protein GldL [Bacteroidaceae bacterium]